MNAYRIYKHIYRILDNATPIGADCGKLCGKRCCESTDEETGMYLFPCEEVMYQASNKWLKLEESDFICGSKRVLIAFCDGRCDRHLRPLSCRIFPFVMRNGRIVIDNRAKGICPIARHLRLKDFDRDFYYAVKRVYNILWKFKQGREYINRTSMLLDEFEELKNKLGR